ncbi:MAG: DUF1599 domain-containing protein [Bacteroidota bacterium]|nr:DUF1599 domain-containing protein [Bacteroidota bacterium]
MTSDTSRQFDGIIAMCKEIFMKKMVDYGTAWRILRPSSLTDQIYIKANRIRSIQELGSQQVDEDIRAEFIGIINYSVMALIQLELGASENTSMPPAEVEALYLKYLSEAKHLMERKNHDYGEAWRNMRIPSITDIILMKLLRVKQIEDNQGKTIISEGIDANYFDMINYAAFALILLDN